MSAFMHGTQAYSSRPSPTGAPINVGLDAAAGVVRWRVDGADVLAVERIGLRSLDARYLKKSQEGPEAELLPRQLSLGFGLFTDRLFGQGARLYARHASVTAG
jgi:hypothetical protein